MAASCNGRGYGWIALEGSAKDIGIGADGDVWIVGKAAGAISRCKLSRGWEATDGHSANISVGPNGVMCNHLRHQNLGRGGAVRVVLFSPPRAGPGTGVGIGGPSRVSPDSASHVS